MALTLTIENMASLPDGGPLSVSVSGPRGLDIGRDQHLDWTLPDPTRTVSGKHCEVRYHDGAYWLTDVSTNGTYLNGSGQRMQSPHRLRHGDRIEIGDYIIAVALDATEPASLPAEEAPGPSARATEFWSSAPDAAPPAPRRDFQPARELRPVRPDFLDWAVETPDVAAAEGGAGAAGPAPAPGGAPAGEDLSWAAGPVPQPPAVAAVPPVPTPRRPPAAAAANPWSEPPEPSSAPPPAQEPARAAEQGPPPAVPFPAAQGADFLARFARGAGLPEEALAGRDVGEFAEHLGVLMRLVADDLKQLLAARAEGKRLARSASQTTIQAVDNNPLKFSPTVEDALRLMFGPPASGYLDARQTLAQSFRDLKIHQVKTYSAMQHALRMLMEDLAPEAIDEATGDAGIGGLIGSRKARLWDAYVARWQAKTAPHEHGLVDAFMIYFAECYDKGGRGG
ncbi:hypothetical protein AL346_04530 [Chelatococcus sp. CO-6]|uniref:type VI secretion system-associated FHA domain protein TagH n=3 Tax=unclassified Chelatococcus TaxID=2638111 RepID=UPI0006BD0BF6|nr:type VI secretion system-associated FHA domain protein TagH [Chelatococcus sp. CO-6]ALA16811.1 hypothetical protein AL346_04530 [Chelatococcus sp. CO-6]